MQGRLIPLGLGVREKGRQEYVPEPVDAEGVEILVGEIEFEPAFEVFDTPLYRFPVQRINRNRHFL